MVEIRLDEEALGYLRLFQNLSKIPVKDCVELGGRIIFVVEEGTVARAVGKHGENVVRFNRLTGKDVLVIEFSPKPEVFVQNVFRNYGVRGVEIEDREGVVHATVSVDPSLKGKAIGRDGRNLRMAREIIGRHHAIQSVSVA
jgi:N utilization substance protein A